MTRSGRAGSTPAPSTNNTKIMKTTRSIAQNIIYHNDNVEIIDSYKITSLKDMNAKLNFIKKQCDDINRSVFSMRNEWRTHNLFYDLHIYRNRTKNVNLNKNLKWYLNIAYFIGSMFYFKY